VNTKLDDQPRYQSSVNCHWWPIFEGLNDWTVASLFPGKKGENDKSDDIFEAQNLFLDAMAGQAQLDIVVGGVGVFATEDPDVDGYYLVGWVDEPRTLDEDLSLVEFEPPIVLKRGERVVRAKYYNEVPRATRWYSPSTTLLTTVRLQQVLVANLEIHTESATSKLPNTYNKVAARSTGARMINVNDHEKIVDEIARCAILDFYEEEDDDDEEEEEDDNNEEEDDNNDDEEEDYDEDI
jgi:hypothetical protein